MLVRQITRSLWNTLKVEKRFLASDPIKPKQEVDDGVEPVQVRDFLFYYLTILSFNETINFNKNDILSGYDISII